MWIPHAAKIVAFEPGRRFVDEMTRGLFKRFRHRRLFQPSDGGTPVTDRVEFALGCGAFVDRRVVRPVLDYSFRKRHEALQAFFAAEAPASTAADPGL